MGDNIPSYIWEVILCFPASQQVGDRKQSDEEGEIQGSESQMHIVKTIWWGFFLGSKTTKKSNIL